MIIIKAIAIISFCIFVINLIEIMDARWIRVLKLNEQRDARKGNTTKAK